MMEDVMIKGLSETRSILDDYALEEAVETRKLSDAALRIETKDEGEEETKLN